MKATEDLAERGKLLSSQNIKGQRQPRLKSSYRHRLLLALHRLNISRDRLTKIELFMNTLKLCIVGLQRKII